MKKNINKIKKIYIEDELKKSYLDYAMSVIIGRALPDVRDGLKPVHRRILYAMYILEKKYNKQYKKSARIVGDVIGKYHPHGDSAVYESIVRMAQKFSLRYTLIDGQGNFGSIDGDPAAAMRYTEIRMSKITKEFLYDIDKNTVNFLPNYDSTEKIPEILPTKIPNILINGVTGIAVGMATNIPPHNISEIMNAFIAFIDNKNISIKELMNYIPGPDFPTGGIIENNDELYNAYCTGKGTIYIRAKIKKEKKTKKKKKIIIYELPYQVNKRKLIEKITKLVKEKKIEGINTLRDESDKDGLRINIEIKKEINSDFIINKLLFLTNLRISYGINIVALYKNQPQVLNLKKILKIFLKHRKKIIKNKTFFELKKKKSKIHILEGFLITKYNINIILEIIKNSKNKKIAKEKIIKIKWIINNKIKKYFKNKNEYKFSEKQIESILNLNLCKLTKFEQIKIKKEYFFIKKEIKNLEEILNSKYKLENIIKNEFIYIKKKFGDKRLTKIKKKIKKINKKDLIKKENVVVTLSKHGYIKYQKLSKYEIQHRGGKGKLAAKIKKEDFIQKILVTNTHENIFLFSNKGKLFFTKVYNLPYYGRTSKGKPLINFFNLEKKEKITTIISLPKYKLKNNILLVTSFGLVKKIEIKKLNIYRKNSGLNIINLKKNDELISVNLTNGENKIMLFSKLGKALKFSEKYIRNTGRSSCGVKGINLLKNDKVVSSIILNNKKYEEIVIVTENGYGKRTFLNEFSQKSRATKGCIFIKINKKNGPVIGVKKIKKNDQIIIVTNTGNLIRISVSEINILKRNTQGIILIRKKNINEKIMSLQRI